MKKFYVVAVVVSAFSFLSCGEDAAPGVQVVKGPGDQVAYDTGSDVVVVDGTTYVVTGDPGTDCVEIAGACVDLSKAKRDCGEGSQVDVIVVDGVVESVICYPPKDSGTPIEEVTPATDGTITIPQNDSGAVITFGEATDGVPVEGDVTLDAERTVLYGNGIGKTILADNLTVASNNSQIRGLTVKGNVTFTENSNNSAMTFCEIQGNLQVHSNSFTAADCQVFGDVSISGNNAVLANIGVGGNWDVSGSGALCDGCYSFQDADKNFVVADGEVGELLTCSN
ncbi:MAG: hypothetical protein AUK47_11480 [Deltaproteobacteria bacterium CG2_30_63_29]|nr:MAG: hypothetical protein AUK47_11480 [Deltaproteobacteria bacterium CG2_30_63_29]PJB49280.1 MAG: hypothetical protein CO108_00390 [Deltaproteobacteria bacterium CG_4_9_14_3_um_filter_63_12]